MAGAGLVLAALAAYVAWRRGTRMGWSLAVMLVAVAWWGTAYAVELSVDEIADKGTWGDLKYVGVVTLAPAWLVFVLQYTGRGQRVTRRLVGLLAVPPVVALTVLAVPATHDLVRSYPATAATDELPIVESGPAFWAIFAYNNLLLVGATVLFLASMVRLARTYRRMALVLLSSALLPWAANLLHNLEVGPFARIDLTPFAFILTGGLLVWGLFEERLVDLAPLARSAVVESMADAVFVLDAFGRIVDVNPAAVSLADRPRRELVGRRLRDLVDISATAEVGPGGLVLGEPGAGNVRTFDVSQQPLKDISDRTAGELVVLREVTERVRDQQRLEQVLEDRSRVAATLQASMVPTRLPAVPRCELASRYVPAGDGGEIGGDFLDVFPLDEETWAFVPSRAPTPHPPRPCTRSTTCSAPRPSPNGTARSCSVTCDHRVTTRVPRHRCGSPCPSRGTTGRWCCAPTARWWRSACSAPRWRCSTTPSCTTPVSSSHRVRCCASSPTGCWRPAAGASSSAPSGSPS
jgi:PAS domain-containing protein